MADPFLDGHSKKSRREFFRLLLRANPGALSLDTGLHKYHVYAAAGLYRGGETVAAGFLAAYTNLELAIDSAKFVHGAVVARGAVIWPCGSGGTE